MSPARRESLRALLDETRTPEHAHARKLLASAAYWPPEQPEIDACLLCGLEGFGCVCDPTAPSDVERQRRTRLTRSELAAERDGR